PWENSGPPAPASRALVPTRLVVEAGAVLAGPRDPLDKDERRSRDGCRVLEPQLDVDIVAFVAVLGADLAVQAHRSLRQPHPEPGDQRRKEEPERNRVQRLGAERPRDDVGQETEAEQRAAPGGHTGTGVCSRASWTSSRAVRPAERASGASIRRCASTGSAAAFTSGGSRNSRPNARARVFATRRSAIPARRPAPP